MTRQELEAALAAPFDPGEVKFKPSVVNGNRAMALAYVDARVIQNRLDEVLGVTGWTDEYTPLANGSMLCKLSLKMGDEWVSKMDVGGESEQADEGDRTKAAVSDALKRAAVKFGIGRYLYRLGAQWVDYDTQKKKFVKPPTLPPAAVPLKKADADVVETMRQKGSAMLEAGAEKGLDGMRKVWSMMPPPMRLVCYVDKERIQKRLASASEKGANNAAAG